MTVKKDAPLELYNAKRGCQAESVNLANKYPEKVAQFEKEAPRWRGWCSTAVAGAPARGTGGPERAVVAADLPARARARAANGSAPGRARNLAKRMTV